MWSAETTEYTPHITPHIHSTCMRFCSLHTNSAKRERVTNILYYYAIICEMHTLHSHQLLTISVRKFMFGAIWKIYVCAAPSYYYLLTIHVDGVNSHVWPVQISPMRRHGARWIGKLAVNCLCIFVWMSWCSRHIIILFLANLTFMIRGSGHRNEDVSLVVANVISPNDAQFCVVFILCYSFVNRWVSPAINSGGPPPPPTTTNTKNNNPAKH